MTHQPTPPAPSTDALVGADRGSLPGSLRRRRLPRPGVPSDPASRNAKNAKNARNAPEPQPPSEARQGPARRPIQRGFYSEVLGDAPADPGAVSGADPGSRLGANGWLAEASGGPPKAGPRGSSAAPRQREAAVGAVGRSGREKGQQHQQQQHQQQHRHQQHQQHQQGYEHGHGQAQGQRGGDPLEPKVMAQYNPSTGQPPRKVEIERKKRLFAAQDVELLLRREGVDYSLSQEERDADSSFPTYLPLEAFDNTDFEGRTPEQWVGLGMVDGEMIAVPGKGLKINEDGSGAWMPCRMLGYNAETERYLVEWQSDVPGAAVTQATPSASAAIANNSNNNGGGGGGGGDAGGEDGDGARAWISRINLLFLAEDPFLFAKRVAWAHAARREAEALLRYNLYVDSMPIDEIPPLDSTQVKRILSSALNNKRLRGKRLDTAQLVKETNKDYARTMNKIVFDAHFKSAGATDLFASLELPPLPDPEPAPEFGTVAIPDHNFPEQFSEFAFHSFLTKSEVIGALVKVRSECNRIEQMTLFNTFFSKSVRLDEFDQMQAQANAQVVNNLKESWITTLKNAIRNSLREVGKGWFNLHESRREVYEMSKLRKFMATVNFMMQDSLRFLAEGSLETYARFIENAASEEVTVGGTADVRGTYESEDARRAARKSPLFLVDLVVRDNAIVLSSPVDACGDVPVSVFDRAISLLQDIPQLEPLVLEDLYWAHRPVLACVHEKEARVERTRARIRAALARSLGPLAEYLAAYDEHREFAALDPAAYIAEFQGPDSSHSVADLRREVQKHFDERARLEESLPVAVNVGMFAVSCAAARSFLVDKRSQLAKMVLEVISKRARAMADEVSAVYHKVHARLSRRPEAIEELVDMREYIGEIPRETAEAQQQIKSMAVYYDALDDFKFPLAPDDFNVKWVAYGWPRRTLDRLDEVERYLEHDKAKFQTDLVRDQEMFQYELEDIGRTVVAFSERNDFSKVAEYSDDVERVEAQLRNAQAKAAKYNSREHLFEFELTEYSDLDKITKNFEPYANFWKSAHNWIGWKKEWTEGAFQELDPEDMDVKLTGAWKTMYRSIKFFQDRNTGCLQVATDLKQEMDAFKPSMPLITSLRNRGMRDRHWADLAAETGHDLSPNPEQTLTSILALDLSPHMEAITKVCELAGKEYSIEQALDNMEEAWKGVSFEIVAYRNSGTFVMRGSDDIVQLLDDHTAMTQSMSFSVFKKPFEERIQKWEAKLNLVSDIVDEWLACQRAWLYLEPIFSSDDINRQMPTEGKRFTTVDRMWRKVMNSASQNPEVMAVAAVDKVLENFKECNKLLDMIQKGLSDYLETKCAAFSRFYFLSPDELLQILSQTKDPTAVQPHLRKCFEAIASVTFQEDLQITEMISAENEVIPFSDPFYPRGNVEAWLLELERVMRKSLKGILTAAVHSYKKNPRPEWVRMYPGQITIAASQIHWSVEVETAIRKGGVAGLERLYKKLLRQLDDLTGLVRGKLEPLERITLGSLIVIDVHARDVVKRLIDAGVSDVQDFDWISQLRYYWVNNDCEVRMVNARYMYGYEYLGNTGRLVITPLTDRCYMTLMGALHLQMGGAPQGPAGTGKTETCKDLAKALAKQCVVFNCSDGLDYLAMGKFFKGLASSGAWACFDEFNRIDLEVLSVIAQQIITIQKAIQNGLKRFFFEGTEIGLDPTCAVFITMNPGYAGRTELPDNLKALFRPVAMMIPDYALIAEIMLFSYGFSDAYTLARKMVATFRLSSEQLSSQDHYDFGMRAVKTVISAAGNLKRADPDLDEPLLLLRALKDVNLPKFLSEDIPLFNGIILDLFPGVTESDAGETALRTALNEQCAETGLQPHPAFIHKCIQLYETLVVRHGVMLVGPTGGGKTCNYKTLARAMTSLRGNAPGFEAVHYSIVNPKSITMGQLYGQYDENTHEWTDGVLAALVRNGSADTRPDKNWVIFDGPVDAIWIENMNTVLDDNKKLCLNSGEIIKLSAAMSMMFEVEDLAVASPATVSRCGMVYMEPSQLGTEPLVRSYISCAHPTVRAAPVGEKLEALMEALLDPGLAFLRRAMTEVVGSVDNNLAGSLFRLLDCLFTPFLPQVRGGEEKAPELKDLHLVVEPLFLFALIWSVGGTCDYDSRRRFDTWLREEVARLGLSTEFPEEGLVYDYHYDIPSKSWVNWMETVPEFFCDPKAEFFSIMVPTIDTVRQTFLLDLLAMQGKPVLCVGDTGTGKSVNVRNKLLKGLPQNYTPLFVSFSARTSANQTQDILDAKMDRRRKGVFGPPAGKKFIVFVDDVNMPAREVYGAQPPIELLRQWLDHGGWYDRKLLTFKEIIDTQFVCAMGPPGGGRNPVTNRFLRQFNMLAYPRIGDESVHRIFGTIFAAHLSSAANSFSDAVKDLADPLTDATIQIYNTISNELLPTPSKSHYTFNLRDLAKVFQGTLLAKMFHPSVNADFKRAVTAEDVVRLWAHEATRVFEDRLVDAQDRAWFQKLVTRQVNESLGMADFQGTAGMLFGDFSIRNAFPRLYTEIRDRAALENVLSGYLEDYNAESTTPMNLVLFEDAVAHLARISRIIRQPLGHALLLGVGGSGRQSLSRLAAHMAEYHLKQIEVAKGYGMTEWRDDIKALMAVAGLENKPCVFLFSDTQIVQEAFLEDINSILNSGDVPNMYAQDELDSILTEIGNDARKAGVPSDKASLYDFYVQRCRRNVHVVLAMSPVGEVFRSRLRQFPSLVNSCTIDWFSEWPDEALLSVATALLSGVDLGSDAVKDAVTSMFTHIHQSVAAKSEAYALELRRYNYVTPTSFLEVINTYTKLLEAKRQENANMSKRLEIGLDKLDATGAEVGVMQKELVALQPVLIQTTKEAEEMMVAIAKDKKDADVTKAEVVREKAEAAKQTEETAAIAADAQKDLDEALPALEEAVASLRTLDKSAINEVQSMLRPPQGVRTVMEAVCIMRGVKPARVAGDKPGEKVSDYWPSSQTMLRDPGFMNALMTFDKDNIPESIIDKIQPYIQSESFTPQAVAKVSKACTSLCMWVRAMEKYYWVSKAVAPKKAKLREAEESLRVTMESLDKAKQRLQSVEDNIRGLERKYDDMLAKKDEYQRKVQDCEAKLDRAQKLIGGLGGEKDRWTATIQSLAVDFDNLVGDVLLSSGVVAYQGSFTGPFRASLTRDWRERIGVLGIPHSASCSLTTTLGDPVAVRMWNVHGLPSDQNSVENGIIISKARRWPLMIDPQGQANRWVKNMEAENGLDVIRLSEKDFLRSLENGVRFGKPVLLENIGEELDPALEPLLLKQTFRQGGSEVIRLGDAVIPYHPDFRFYITTKLPNPHYAPESQVKVTLLNFTITPEGMEDQLLGIVVAKERPDLEEMKNQLTVSNAKMRKELKDLEDRILELLSTSQGNILDDESLIEVLSQSKRTSEDILLKVAEAETTEKEIDSTRLLYKPVAFRAAIMFFCIGDLAAIDPMYQYSLMWFTNLFTQSFSRAPASTDLDERLASLTAAFTEILYNNVCRSLFERHKLLFSFLLAIRLETGQGKIDPAELRFLIAGGAAAESRVNPAPEWLTQRSWGEILAISQLPSFVGFADSFSQSIGFWKKFFDDAEPHRLEIPGKLGESLTPMQRLIITRALRPDRVTAAVQDYVTNSMGKQFIEPPTFNISGSFGDSDPATPLVFILSTGSDPAADLYKFADEMRFGKKLQGISLGQGQGPRAEALIREATDRGTWVLLQNCHLAISWMPALERFCESIDPQKVHRDFRLWLTSMPSDKFPVSILQNSVKMTLEPPKGLKANLMQSYDTFDDAFLNNESAKPAEWKKLLFALCFFHASILERRSYGALGWNVLYEFSRGDLQISMRQLSMFLDEYKEAVPYKVLLSTAGDVNYGGRVTDDWDRRTLKTILAKFYCPDVLKDGYQFSVLKEYRSIPVTDVKGYREYLRDLPINDSPLLYGLHENADVTKLSGEADAMFESLLRMQPRTSAGGGKSREEAIDDLARSMLEKIPALFNVEDAQERFKVDYAESMNTVLVQEILRYQRVLRVARASLETLLKALKGLVVMSADLEKVASALFDNHVPEAWSAVSYPSLKPLASWVDDLTKRCETIADWCASGKHPAAYWISGFYFPQAFLTGTLQNFARRHRVAIDQVSFDYAVIRQSPEEITVPPEDGCYVYGLFLEGGRWDEQRHVITEARDKELFNPFPVVHLIPVADRTAPTDGIYTCPVYKTSKRAGTLSTTGHSTNFVTSIEIPSAHAADHWILRGCALLCGLPF